MNPSATLPIGIFDSGMGGLTVLKAISGRLPGENLLYLGDTARLPYGTKSRDTIIRYTLKAAGRLVDEGVKMLVVACNTATSAALPELREHFAPLPVLGVVRPGAEAAVAASRNKRIVDSAETAAVAVENRLRELGLLRGEDAPGSHRFMTTDNVLRFIRTGSLFLGHPLKSAEVSLVDLS